MNVIRVVSHFADLGRISGYVIWYQPLLTQHRHADSEEHDDSIETGWVSTSCGTYYPRDFFVGNTSSDNVTSCRIRGVPVARGGRPRSALLGLINQLFNVTGPRK